MQSITVFILFVGVFLIVHGVYEEKFRSLEDNVRVEYRFLPRTYYEEQLANTDVSGKFKNMFETSSPWNQQME
jgi:hypothetical protein